MLKKLTLNLVVEDVNRTIEFYQSILGCFELLETDPKKGKFDWALMRCEDLEIMFQSKNSLVERIPKFKTMSSGGTIIIYIEVDNIEYLYAWMKDKVKIIEKLHTTPYKMKEFLVEDCNGFILTFAQWI
jgi:uncharacterized glyoxalase superfamily protein PhnB